MEDHLQPVNDDAEHQLQQPLYATQSQRVRLGGRLRAVSGSADGDDDAGADSDARLGYPYFSDSDADEKRPAGSVLSAFSSSSSSAALSSAPGQEAAGKTSPAALSEAIEHEDVFV